MLGFLKKFWYEEDGIETLEVLMVIAIIVVIAVLFRDKITDWVNSLIKKGDSEMQNITSG